MSNNKPYKIIRKIDIPKLQLWFTWLILFLLPSIISIVCFKYFQKEYLYFFKTDLIYASFDKIKNYNEAIKPEIFLKNRLELIKKIDTNKELEDLKKDIDKILCGESLICMFFDENSNNTATIKNPKAAITSINFLKNNIINYLKSVSANISEQEKKESQAQLASRLQVIFKTPTQITVDFDKVSVNFSIINDGELYFFLIKFEKPNSKCSSLFSVIRGKDFSFHKMLEELHNSYPEARIVFKEININKNFDEELTKDVKPSFYSGLKQNKNNLCILTPVNSKLTRHILHGGSANLNLKYGYLYPYIEYQIPLSQDIISLKKVERIINYFVLFIILISAIYFIHISLFGLNPNWKFKSKIISLTVISAIIPFSIFTIGIYSWDKLNRFISKIHIEQHINIQLQIFSWDLENYLTTIEANLNEQANLLIQTLKKPDLTASEFSKILKEISEKIPFSKYYILLDHIPDNLRTMLSNETENMIINSYPERISDVSSDQQKQAVISKIPSTVFEYAKEEKVESREAKDTFMLAGRSIRSTEINESLLNTGKLIPIFDSKITLWYNITLLHKNNSKKILGVFSTIFEPKPILYFYFKNSILSEKGFKEIKGDYEINYAFLPVEKSGNAGIWSGCGNISQQDKEICLYNSQSKQIHLSDRTIITKLNLSVPHLAVAIVKELNQYNEKDFIIKVLVETLLFLLLIVYFSNKLLDLIFVEPVMKLASNANSIAKGGEEWYTEIKSGDEFETLNNKFKDLVAGLKARNILKSYVSEDAFSEIKENESLKLSPGGEYIEATIVFSALKDYEILSQQITPQESIQLLSRFMAIAEEVTREFGGSIDKIIGDTIMLVFRDNSTETSHGLRAAQAALKLVEKTKSANLPQLYTGIASDRVISGRIGSYSGKLDFTVIGNPVNLAARLKTESKNGTEGTGIIISGTTIGLTKGKAIVKYLRRVSIKGKARQYNIYELLGIRNQENS